MERVTHDEIIQFADNLNRMAEMGEEIIKATRDYPDAQEVLRQAETLHNETIAALRDMMHDVQRKRDELESVRDQIALALAFSQALEQARTARWN